MYDYRINELVKDVIKQYGTSDPYEIADMCNINVEREEFDDLKGMYTVIERCPFIILNTNLNKSTEKLVMFHELGHHFLHREFKVAAFKDINVFGKSSKFEVEANTFAANFMICDEDIICAAYDGYTSEQAASLLHVPHDLVLIKIKDLDNRGYDFRMCVDPKPDFLSY